MCWCMLFLTLLAIFGRRCNAGIRVSNTAKYDERRLMHLPWKSFASSLSLCKQNSSTSSSLPFASHTLPDGAVLELCLEPAGIASFSSSGSDSYAGFKVMKLERKLVGNGAHRELKTFITVRLEKFEECHMVIVERLSSGVFADMFELQGLVARAVFNDASIYGDHNLELPAKHSFESMVVVHTGLKSKFGDPIKAHVSLPLHARYPPLSLESHVVVNIKCPILLFQCFWDDENAYASRLDSSNASRKKTSWAQLTMKDNSLSNSTELQWHVPAGNPQHAGTVAALTAFFSIVGVVILWVVSTSSYELRKVKIT